MGSSNISPVPSPPTPGPPRLTQPVDAARQADSLNVEWTLLPGWTGYEVHLVWSTGQTIVTPAANPLLIGGLVPNRSYSISVRISQNQQVSPWSAPLDVVTRPARPSPPRPGPALGIQSCAALDWDATAEASSGDSPANLTLQLGMGYAGQVSIVAGRLSLQSSTLVFLSGPDNLYFLRLIDDSNAAQANESVWSTVIEAVTFAVPDTAPYGMATGFGFAHIPVHGHIFISAERRSEERCGGTDPIP